MDDDESSLVIPIDNELDQRIYDTFVVHDPSGNKLVDAETLAIIIRALGVIPTNKEINVIFEKLQKKTHPGFVHIIDFIPFMAKEITEGKYKPASLREILQAFQTLDKENFGYFTKEELRRYMTEYGEPLDEEEVLEMLEVAYDGFSKKVHYEGFVRKLRYNYKDDDIYKLAQKVEDEKPKPIFENRRRFSQLVNRNQSQDRMNQ